MHVVTWFILGTTCTPVLVASCQCVLSMSLLVHFAVGSSYVHDCGAWYINQFPPHVAGDSP